MSTVMNVLFLSPPILQLSAAQTEVERLKLELMSVTSKAEQERLATREEM